MKRKATLKLRVALAMSMALVAALLITPSLASPLTLVAQLGVAVQLQSAVQTVLQVAGGLAFHVTPSAPCSITLQSVSSLGGILGGGASLPAGCQQLTFAGGGLLGLGNALGYTIAVSPASVALQSATLITGAVQNAGAISASSPCGCVSPSIAEGYATIAGVAYNAATAAVSIPISSTACQETGSATYIPVAIQSQVASQLGAAVQIVGNSQQTINYNAGAAAAVALQFQSAAQTQVQCTQSSVAAGAGAAASALIGAGTSIGQFTQFYHAPCTSHSTIKCHYKPEHLKDYGVCDERRVRLAVWNNDCQCFRVPTSGGAVDITGSFASQVIATSGSTIPQCALVEQPYALGAAVSVKAAQTARIAYTSGCNFAGQAAGAASITVKALANVGAASKAGLPAGCTPLAFQGAGPEGCTSCAGSGVGYSVASSGSAITGASLSSAPVTPACAQQIQQVQASGGVVECHRYDSHGVYQGASPAYYDHNTRCVRSDVPSCKGDRYVYACRHP